MVVFCKAILRAIKGNDSKTLPIFYEVCYQTKLQFFKSGRTAKNLKLKRAKARELNYKLSKTF